ncbi:TetR/AcrR family transcriptional regulator [Umezawaea sp. NPDC059074]|uniref:TetR/AcrR family transcriptional regulator n=1 Tax=Umezawaea sp. NPDC059074 TaxID=3346716 RepID=UPI0036B24748
MERATAEATVRYEKGHKEATRQRITEVASRRFRDEGISAVGLAGVMSDAGLTNGAFYAHFESKEDLVREVVEQALEGQRAAMTAAVEERGLEGVVRDYLDLSHRDQRAEGCPSAALLDEIGRRPEATRDAYTRRLLALVDVVAAHLVDDDPEVRRVKALAVFGSLVGTLQLARAITDEKLSAHLLEQGVRAAMTLIDTL